MVGSMKFGLRQAAILFVVLMLIRLSESQASTVTPGCETCSPSWIKMLPQYFALGGGNGLAAKGKMCNFARNQTLFTPCDATTRTCADKNQVKFKCCEIKCLTAIQPCFETPLADNYCIPSKLGPWMSTLIALFLGCKTLGAPSRAFHIRSSVSGLPVDMIDSFFSEGGLT